MNYKRVIRNQQTRIKILKLFKWIPDKWMVKIQYLIKFGFWPNFNKPKRFSEKLQLYKIHYRDPKMTRCVDKYTVRTYIKEKGYENILTHLYGIYNNLNDIDFDSFPEKIVVKSTTGGGGLNVIIVKNKSERDIEEIKKSINSWNVHRKGNVCSGREWAYYDMADTRILVEELLEDPASNDLLDFKFFCFNGKPFCVQVDSSRQSNHHQNYYDVDWNSLGVYCSYPQGDIIEKPINFDKMLTIAADLSKDFPFVRVDLYNIQGIIYFGEMTFYPSSGYGKFHPDSFDYVLGDLFTKYK